MKTSLEHLPKNKQEQLHTVRDMIKVKTEAELIILFGSYATGTWVEDYQEKYEYVSDFDILVVTASRATSKRSKIWRNLEKDLRNAPDITKTNIIHHSINFVNDKIGQNSYFFGDIYKEGIALFDSGNFKLDEPRELIGVERQKKATDEYEHWFESANHFYDDYLSNMEKDRLNKAAFELHQATERYYSAILLVFTDYKPKSHDLDDLGNQAMNCHAEFMTVFPRSTEEEKHRFELLKRSYIDARYTKSFQIGKEDLEYLGPRVEILKSLTQSICSEKIKSFV